MRSKKKVKPSRKTKRSGKRRSSEFGQMKKKNIKAYEDFDWADVEGISTFPQKD